jgi:hypothetical protein
MNDQQDTAGNVWKGGAIVLVTFALTLLIYFACARFLDSTKGRFKPLARWSEPGDPAGAAVPAGGAGRSTGYSPFSPGVAALPPRVTAGPGSAPGYGVPAPPLPRMSEAISPPPQPLVSVQYRPGQIYFRDAGERRAAQGAISGLRLTLQSIRKYDSRSFWEPLAPVSGTATAQGYQPEDTAPGRVFAADTEGDPERKRQNVAARIANETEALATELSLVAHPDAFPEELREQVKQIGTEARIYLSTVQVALTRPAERDRLRTLAQAHLFRSETLLRDAERAVGML